MPKSDLIVGVILMLFGISLLTFIIPDQTSEGGDATISPALLPQICAIGITGLAILLSLRAAGALRRGQAAGQTIPTAECWSAVTVIIAVTGAVALFTYVHPALAAGLLVLGLMLYMGERRIGFLISFPAALLIGSWYLFYQVLGTAIS
ncbi:MAG: hypothetical protein HOI95_28100 [Chromatiales bacterium]|jgi:putative tricarboxylic transport membrane protein|nr:hypothetical protein [Chromatiales bacterium]